MNDPTITYCAPPRPSPERLKPEGFCSFCAVSGTPGVAIVCGRRLACPSCTAPGYAATLAKYGADAA